MGQKVLCSCRLIKPEGGGSWELLNYSQSVWRAGNNWVCNWHVKWLVVYGTEPLTCGMWCSLWADSAGTELESPTLCWRLRIAGWCREISMHALESGGEALLKCIYSGKENTGGRWEKDVLAVFWGVSHRTQQQSLICVAPEDKWPCFLFCHNCVPEPCLLPVAQNTPVFSVSALISAWSNRKTHGL